MMYRSNFQKFPTFSMCRNQWVHQKSTKNKQNTNTGNKIKNFDARGVESDMGAV